MPLFRNDTKEKIVIPTHRFQGATVQQWIKPGEEIELEDVNERERYATAARKAGLTEVKKEDKQEEVSEKSEEKPKKKRKR